MDNLSTGEKFALSIIGTPAAGSTVMSRVTLRTPTDLLAAVPYLLGFHPDDSVVVIGLSGPRVVFSARADLPPPDDVLDLADQLGGVLIEQAVELALVIGYGEPTRVTPCVLALRAALPRRGIEVGEVLRATDGRYWSYLCESVRCCPPEGTPYDVSGTEMAAVATYAGQVALPDRATLERTLAPVSGPERDAVERATEAAARELAGQAERAANPGVSRRRAGIRALVAAVRCYESGGRLADDDLARITLLLTSTDVRDSCWARVTAAGPDLGTQQELWRDVTRRARADLVPGPATLLAYAAYRAGNGALARVALDRALAADPAYSLAALLGQALDHALPPALLDDPPARRRPRRGRRRARPVSQS